MNIEKLLWGGVNGGYFGHHNKQNTFLTYWKGKPYGNHGLGGMDVGTEIKGPEGEGPDDNPIDNEDINTGISNGTGKDSSGNVTRSGSFLGINDGDSFNINTYYGGEYWDGFLLGGQGTYTNGEIALPKNIEGQPGYSIEIEPFENNCVSPYILDFVYTVDTQNYQSEEGYTTLSYQVYNGQYGNEQKVTRYMRMGDYRGDTTWGYGSDNWYYFGWDEPILTFRNSGTKQTHRIISIVKGSKWGPFTVDNYGYQLIGNKWELEFKDSYTVGAIEDNNNTYSFKLVINVGRSMAGVDGRIGLRNLSFYTKIPNYDGIYYNFQENVYTFLGGGKAYTFKGGLEGTLDAPAYYYVGTEEYPDCGKMTDEIINQYNSDEDWMIPTTAAIDSISTIAVNANNGTIEGGRVSGVKIIPFFADAQGSGMFYGGVGDYHTLKGDYINEHYDYQWGYNTYGVIGWSGRVCCRVRLMRKIPLLPGLAGHGRWQYKGPLKNPN